MLNLSKLFRNESSVCYINNLELDDQQKTLLREARVEIRNALRDKLPSALNELTGTEFEKPRFFTQGSWAYKTLNAPAQGNQQADLDDGCYLPLSYLQEIKKPSTAAAVFFKAVQITLTPLVKAKGWALVEKPTCTRVEINSKAHIDIPLYAIEDSEFATLKFAEARSMAGLTMDAKYESWDQLPKVKVLLAHREEDWIDSDPRPVKEWFDDQCDLKGEQLRHIIRYLKGYRDFIWEEGGPSSILLMSAAAPIFRKFNGRDDLALEEVLRGLPSALRAGVDNPVNPNESLTDRLKPYELEEIASRYEQLNAKLSAAIADTDAVSVCNWLQHEFGSRLPNRPDLVTITTAEETIKQSPAIITSSPLVGRTEAGH